jgi:crotonobetainyl-CoA:carnitine CoA-transferase CaiB-like acyl-CoA transferase
MVSTGQRASSTPGALSNFRVIDLTQLLTGPFATKHLADYGADVIKIEPPEGEPGRRLAPFKGDDPDREKSGTFFVLNTNKRGITLNLAHEAARDVVRQLVRTADLVVESFPPGYLDSLGLGYGALARERPDIVVLSITNFGQYGPYRDWKGSETILYGMGGEMHSVGLADREPLKQGGTVALFQAGATAAVAAMAGLLAKRRHGIGQHIDFATYEAIASSPDRRIQAVMAYQFSGLLPKRPEHAGHFMTGIYPCKDGFVEFWCDMPRWERAKALLGHPPELEGEEWTQGDAGRDPEKVDTFDRVLLRWLATRTKREAWHEAQAQKILCAPTFTSEDFAGDPYYRERGFWVDVQHAAMGPVTIPGAPFVMHESPWSLRRPAPLLGEHTAEVLTELGYSGEDMAMLRQAGAT